MMRTNVPPFSGCNIPGEREGLAPRKVCLKRRPSVPNTDAIPTQYRCDTA